METGERPDVERRALLGWIGDSPALLLRDGTWHHLTADPYAGDEPITSNRTAGALSHGRLEGLCALNLVNSDVLMLVTDGIGNFVTDGRQDRQLGRLLATLFRGNRSTSCTR
jgi:serine/threonine protein phosphatase PrpC